MYRSIFLLVTLQLLILSSASCEDAQEYYERIYPGDNPRRGLNFTEMAAYDNYTCHAYNVTTYDGYIITIFYIPPHPNCTTVHPIPVVFMHGLYLDGSDCIIPGPGKATCYILSDHCHHVWVGNVRGNRYGRAHVSLDPDKDPQFWNFTFINMGLGDLPAIVDFVLLRSGQKQINFNGFSQGMAAFLIMCSQKPEYNAKFNRAFGMSPTIWLTHARFLPLYIQEALATLFLTPMGEVFRYGGPVQQIANIVCGTSDTTYPGCTAVIFAFLGYNNYTVSPDTLQVVVSCETSGTSYANFKEWGKVPRDGFPFDLSNVTVPMLHVTGTDDNISTPQDMQTLMRNLTGSPNSTYCILPKNIIHLDYVFSDLIATLIAPIYLNYFANGTVICRNSTCN